MGFWSDLWRESAKDWAYGRVANAAGAEIQSNKSYVSVVIRQLRLVNRRVAFSRYYGVVQTYTKLPHLSGTPLEFSTLVTPPQLENVDRKANDHFVVADTRVFGPAPYRGGDLELEIALLAVKSQDLLKPYLTLLGEVSSAAGSAFASAAAPYIDVLKRGIEMLRAPEGTTSLEIGLARSLERPVEGTYFVTRLDAHQYDPRRFSVDDQFRLLSEHGKPVLDAPYIVFTIAASAVRDDWYLDPMVGKAYATLVNAIREQQSLKTINSYREYFNRVVRLSPDILADHAGQILAWVDGQIADALPAAKTSRTTQGPSLPQLSEFRLTPL